jgi:AcrR family transcriptional regulator
VTPLGWILSDKTRGVDCRPRVYAGEVETRILDAASEIFRERGLAGASVDEIASRARAGKR